MKTLITRQKHGVFILGASVSILLQLAVIQSIGATDNSSDYSVVYPGQPADTPRAVVLDDDGNLLERLREVKTHNECIGSEIKEYDTRENALIDVPVPIYSKTRDRWRLLYGNVDVTPVWVEGGGLMVEIDCRSAGFTRCRVPRNGNYFTDQAEEEMVASLENYCDEQCENGIMKGEYTKRVIVSGENRTRVYHLTWKQENNEFMKLLITRTFVN